MKLKDLAKKSELIKVGDGEKEIEVLLTSLTSTDVSERQEYYDDSLKKALAFATERADHIRAMVTKLPREQMVEFVFFQETMYLNWSQDLIDVTNAKAMSDEELKLARQKEVEKIRDMKRKEVQALPDDDLRIKCFLHSYRSIYVQKFSDLMERPTLVLVTKDPKTEERMLSMTPGSDDYIGDLDEKILDDLIAKSAKFRDMIDASAIRRLAEDPNFLLWSPPARNAV